MTRFKLKDRQEDDQPAWADQSGPTDLWRTTSLANMAKAPGLPCGVHLRQLFYGARGA